MASDYDNALAAAAVYAESLLELAAELDIAEHIGEELQQLKALWDAEADFAAMMSSAAIDEDARRESIRKAFGDGRVHALVLNLLLVLNDKRRPMILPFVCEAYRHKLDKKRGREEVFVTTASPLGDRHRQAIRDEIKRLVGREAILVESVNPDMLGGMNVQVADRQYDLTLRRRLRDMQAGLLASSDKHLRGGASRFVTEG